MRKSTLILVALLVVTTSALAVAHARQNPATQAATPSPATIEEVLKTMRADMQTARADMMAKNLQLTAAQAAKFWPLFEAYQKEQSVIMDEMLKSIQKYAETYKTLDDAGALTLVTDHFNRDARMNALRQRYFKQFQTAMPTRLAARAMQIEHRLSLVAQMEIAAKIPLIH